MSAYLPDPIPLEPPPGDPASVDDLHRRVSRAVFCLGVLETSLAGPAGAAPGWRGDDATAAAARVAAVTAVARDSSGALWTAALRLAAHRDVLTDARSRIAALVAQQEDDRAVAWRRLGALTDLAGALGAGTASAAAVEDDFLASEAARRREHAALLDEVAADARATGRVLAGCSAVVGGIGRRGDEERAVAHLAILLTGWGEAELAGRGEELARRLLGTATADERDRLAAEAGSYAGSAVFARALLAELGAEGVGLLLLALGSGQYDDDSSVAAVLAAGLGAATPDGRTHDPVRDVLEATYVEADERYGEADRIALGMAAVLAAGARLPSGGPRPETVARWAGRLLLREREQGVLAGAGPLPAGWDPALADPAAVAIDRLVEAGRSEPAAVLLAEPPVWQTLLSRFWPDGGTALGKLIGVAAAAEGPAGDQAVHAGLTAIGDGLFEGDPTGWEVSRRNVAAVAPALGRAVAAHVGVAAEALWVGVDGTQCAGATDALRGLAYLTVDRDAATTVGRALYDWAGGEVATAGAADAPALVAAVAVPSAFVAAQEYGHRFAYALGTYELQEAAELRQMAWSHSVALVPELLPGIWGQAAGVLEGYAAIALGADGTWENGADRGPRFDSGTGVEQSLAAVDRADVDPAAVAAQARAAFVRTAGALGDPQPAESPESDWFAPILDTFLPQAEARRRPGIADSTGAGVTVRRPG